MKNNPRVKNAKPEIKDIRTTTTKVSNTPAAVDSEAIRNAVKEENSAVVRKYNEKYNHALKAPVPNRRVPYSYILTTAVPPKMKEFSKSGIIITNELDIDPRDLQAMKIFTENVADEQMILLKGRNVEDEDMCVGEVVKVNFSRYRTVSDQADEHNPGQMKFIYKIPQVVVDGYPYLLLDSRDVMMVTPVQEINK